MSFYEALEKYYDHIFPLQQDTLAFLAETCGGPANGQILDLACGTGSYTLALAARGHRVTGVDLDETMIRLAQQKKERYGSTDSEATFLRGDLLKLSALLQPVYTGAFCIGNSLVHMETAGEIEAVLQQIAAVLRRGALLVLQIVNYDRVLDAGVKSLPTLENQEQGVSFERHYSYDAQNHKILFTGILHLPDSSSRTNTIPLYPLRKGELEDTMIKAGFTLKQFYANFSGTPWSKEAPATIAVAAL